MKVKDLKPGDVFNPNLPGMPPMLKVRETGILCRLYPRSGLVCVIWEDWEGVVWSHDHLSALQDVGELIK